MKILTIDCETAPSKAYIWGLFKQNISIDKIVKIGGLLCFAAKWKGSKEVEFYRGPDMVEQAHRLLSEADGVITYNGDSFDLPILNAAMAVRGIHPPDPYKSIDLIKTIRGRFKFVSNKLQHVATEFGLGSKADTGGFDLWKRCLAGDEAAWAKMMKYNIQDVRLTEKLYDRILPWIVNHPNYALYHDQCRPACDKCGGVVKQNGKERTLLGVYQRYRCTRCGNPMRGRYMISEKEERKNVLRPTV